MPRTNYPGGLTRAQWQALAVPQRCLLAARGQCDLLELWRTCKIKRCRRAQRCCGDGKKCSLRPFLADLKNPDLGRPDFRFSFKVPKRLQRAWDELLALPYI